MTRLIRLPEVIESVGLSKTEIYRQMTYGDFPTNISIGARAVAWTESSIEDWINSKINANKMREET